MRMLPLRWRLLQAGAALLLLVAVGACVNDGPGSDFDSDGLTDDIEDPNENFAIDPGETDFLRIDTDGDGCCDGRPKRVSVCDGVPEGEPIACEDCDGDGAFEPCLGETDPLNDDTDNDGIGDRSDPSPLDGFDCSGGGSELAYGDSLPPGKPFPGPAATVTPTAPPAPTPTP